MSRIEKLMIAICLTLAIIGAVLLANEIHQHDKALERIEMKLKSPAK